MFAVKKRGRRPSPSSPYFLKFVETIIVKIVKMSLVIVVLFAVCWLPYQLYFLLIYLLPGNLDSNSKLELVFYRIIQLSQYLVATIPCRDDCKEGIKYYKSLYKCSRWILRSSVLHYSLVGFVNFYSKFYNKCMRFLLGLIRGLDISYLSVCIGVSICLL